MTDEDDLELRLSPDEPDPLERVLIQRPGDLFSSSDLDRRRTSVETAEAASLFPRDDEPAREPVDAGNSASPAALAARARAFGTDALLCGLVSGGAFLAAAASVERSPAAASWIWCAVFMVQVSFFLCVPSLILFGRTPGMALADLTVEREDGEKPPFAAAAGRWLLCVFTALLAGLPLLTVAFDRRRRTPADLATGWPLRPLEEPLR
ncbi:MAG: RDD family protein [Thermoanaerobaculia bacterium]